MDQRRTLRLALKRAALSERMVVVFAPQAQRDVQAIYADLVREAGFLVANRQLARIRQNIENLSAFPEMGPCRTELGVNRRMLVIRPWVAIYRVGTHEVGVIRILHGARDLPRVLRP